MGGTPKTMAFNTEKTSNDLDDLGGSLILGRPLYKPKLVQETNLAIEVWAPLVNARRNDPKAARFKAKTLFCLVGHHWSCQFCLRVAWPGNGWRSRFSAWTYWKCEIGLVAPKIHASSLSL